LASFRKAFPDFEPSTEFYITISFSFRGKVVGLDGKDVFAIGIEQVQPGTAEIPITIAHELFHLYHFKTFQAGGGLYRTLWAEGLASYASAMLVPGQRLSAILGFPGGKMNRCQELLPEMAAELRREMGKNDPRIQRIYFGAESNDTQIPPEAGYYVGYFIAEALAKERSLADLARLEPKAAFPLIARELDRLAAAKTRRLLVFTKCSGFEHDVVKRAANELSLVERRLIDLGKKDGFEVKATKDGSIFSSPELASFDAFLFYTSGMLTEKGTDGQPAMTAQGKAALLEAVKGGKGFIGIHSANDSFHTPGDSFENSPTPDPYIAMIGGEFIRHGPQQRSTMRVASPKFPGLDKAGESFALNEEWYTFRNFAPDLHVILVQETKGMQGEDYQRPPFPATWARKHGKGRVFYTSMGHRDDIWTNPLFEHILLGGIRWAFGDVEADVTPNIREVTPQASVLQPKPKS